MKHKLLSLVFLLSLFSCVRDFNVPKIITYNQGDTIILKTGDRAVILKVNHKKAWDDWDYLVRVSYNRRKVDETFWTGAHTEELGRFRIKEFEIERKL